MEGEYTYPAITLSSDTRPVNCGIPDGSRQTALTCRVVRVHQQLTAWQQQNGQQAEEEVTLLALIEENSHLPAAEQRRYERLRRKRECSTLTKRELTEYQTLLQQLEARNVRR